MKPEPGKHFKTWTFVPFCKKREQLATGLQPELHADVDREGERWIEHNWHAGPMHLKQALKGPLSALLSLPGDII